MADQRQSSAEPTQVRCTGDWSADSKLSCIQNGYWNDPYFAYFNAPSDSTGKYPKRTSLICRGYYVRFKLCDHYLKEILNSFHGDHIQIVCLGAGMDTTYFRLISDKKYDKIIEKYFELDFASVVQRKSEIIKQNELLQNMAKEKLVLIEYDLRNLTNLRDTLSKNGFDFEKPILFYSECVVNYLKPNESEALLSWITSNIKNCIWLAYEQCYPSDAFGRLMVQHFQKNGCPILSIEGNGDMESQKLQLEQTGFHDKIVLNVLDAFLKLASVEEFMNVNEKQQFDEYEPFLTTCLHYSIRIGSNSPKTRRLFSENTLPVPSSEEHSMLDLSNITFVSEIENTFSTHCSVLVDDKIWIFGGTNKNGTRLSGAIEISWTINMDANQFQLMENPAPVSKHFDNKLERVHSAATFIPQLNSLYIFGGRKSPRSPCPAQLICMQRNGDNDTSTMFTINSEVSDTTGPSPRWRHTLTNFTRKDGTICLFLFGGKTEKNVLGDHWIYNCINKTWIIPSSDKSVKPSPRHSHSSCTHEKRESIFIIGGMSSETHINEDALWEYHYNENTWTNHIDLARHLQKVGTSALIYKDDLYVLGGCGSDSAFKLEHFLTRINFSTKEVTHYELNLLPDIFLPFGFTTHLVRQGEQEDDDEFIAIIGGGGNCFSFGTHYNNKCLFLKVSALE